MLTESLPVEIFVSLRFIEPKIAKIINRWPTEHQILEKIIVEHLKDMGIYFVVPVSNREVTNLIVNLLRSSPEILETVQKDSDAEAKRRQSRHSV